MKQYLTHTRLIEEIEGCPCQLSVCTFIAVWRAYRRDSLKHFQLSLIPRTPCHKPFPLQNECLYTLTDNGVGNISIIQRDRFVNSTEQRLQKPLIIRVENEASEITNKVIAQQILHFCERTERKGKTNELFITYLAYKMDSEINRAYKTSIKCREEIVLLSLISFMEGENIWSLFARVKVVSVAKYGLISKSTYF